MALATNSAATFALAALPPFQRPKPVSSGRLAHSVRRADRSQPSSGSHIGIVSISAAAAVLGTAVDNKRSGGVPGFGKQRTMMRKAPARTQRGQQKMTQRRQALTLQPQQQDLMMTGLPVELEEYYNSFFLPMEAASSSSALEMLELAKGAVEASVTIIQGSGIPQERFLALLCDPAVRGMLIAASQLSEFSHELTVAFKDDLELLGTLRQLKHFWNLPQRELAKLLEELARHVSGSGRAACFGVFSEALEQTSRHSVPVKDLSSQLPADVQMAYLTSVARAKQGNSKAAFLYGSAS